MNFKLLHGIGSPSEVLAPESVDIAFLNVQGATITIGLPVCYTTTAASLDGAQAVLPATGQLRTFAGIVTRTTPNNGVGMARAFGYFGSVAIYAHGSSVTIAIDSPMGPGPASLGVSSAGVITQNGIVVAMEASGTICSGGGYIRGFVRAL